MGAIIKRKVLKPQYYDKFSCIGAACEANCCTRPWNIFIDKNTYMLYKKVKNSALKEKLNKYTKRVRGESSSTAQYAKFELLNGKDCPFQTSEGLCEIQATLGENYLSHTCKIYPRNVKAIANVYTELSVSMSCPAAVRVALFDKEPMEFDVEETEFDSDSVIIRRGLTKPSEGEEPTHYIEHGWQMRDAAIDIMQDRHYSIAERIFIIGMMLDKAVRLHDEDKADEIPAALELYRQGTAGGEFAGALSRVEPSETMRNQVSSVLHNALVQRAAQNKEMVFAELLNRFLQIISAMQLTPGEDGKINAGAHFYPFFREMSGLYWERFLADWDHVLENYLVNFIFSEIFPLKYHNKGLNPYHHALILAEQYAMLRMLLCGNYNEEQGFTKAYITRTFSNVAEMNQHSEDPLKIAEFYKTAGLDGLAYLYHLLV